MLPLSFTHSLSLCNYTQVFIYVLGISRTFPELEPYVVILIMIQSLYHCFLTLTCWSLLTYRNTTRTYTSLYTLNVLALFSLRRTPACSAWWWTPIKCCPFTQRRSSTCTKGRNDMKSPLISTPSLIMPTGTWCKVRCPRSSHLFGKSTYAISLWWSSDIIYVPFVCSYLVCNRVVYGLFSLWGTPSWY